MKNFGLLLLFWIGLSLSSKAQITITNAVFPAVGDTLFYAVDNQPVGIIMTPPGGNQQWDFSNLQASLTLERAIQAASAGPDYASFPAATLYYQTGAANVGAYLSVSAQQVALLGISGPDASVLGLDLVAKYNPPIAQNRAPVQFFDINQVSAALLLTFPADLLPGTGQLPIAPDSLRLRIAINRLDVVDGWGALAIPGGTYDVLREKRTEYRETRLDAKVPLLGWLDVTDAAIQALQLTSLGVDTTITYHFLNDQSKEAIAICTMDGSGLQALSVQYKNLGTPTGIAQPEPALADLTIFPNPAKEALQIRASSLPGGDYTVQIYNLLGQEAYRQTHSAASGQLEEQLDIGSLEKGVYVCKLFSGNRLVGQALFIKQ
jgi:hypothetical protein